MATKETPWYELIGQSGISPNLLVKCNYFANAASAEEIKNVEIRCEVPMIKLAYCVSGKNGATLKEGCYDFAAEGVNSFTLQEVLPLEELKQYETQTADNNLATTVTLITGHEVGGSFAFRCYLHPGKTTTELPYEDLKAQLDAIPIAKNDMTEAELRQICMD